MTTQKLTSNDLQAEYENAVKQGNAIIKKVAPVKLSEQSIEDIHYWYRYAAELLIQKGDPKHKIASKLYEDFEQFYGERHIRRILKDGGLELPEQENGQMSENNSSLNTPNQYEQENEQELVIADELEDLIHIWKSLLRTGPWASLIEPKRRTEDNTLKRGLIAMAKGTFDGRQLVITPMQPLLLHCAIEYTMQDAYDHYLTEVKDLVKKMTADSKARGIRTIEAITSKQMGRLLSLTVREVHESLEPATVKEARAKGFSGQTCPKCKGLRCNRLADSTLGRWYRCVPCEIDFEGKDIPAYVRGVVIDDSKVL